MKTIDQLDGQSFKLETTPWQNHGQIADIDLSKCIKVGIPHLDNVFGDIIPGTTMSMSAPSGTGKTTFFLQVCQAIAIQNDIKVGYISSEQDVEYLKLTATRCNVIHDDIEYKNESNIDVIASLIMGGTHKVIIIDSITKLYTDEVKGKKRTNDYAQNMLIGAAKRADVTVVFICHMNRDGTIKGGSDLPHNVDTELYIDPVSKNVRRFYTKKNRHGASSESSMVMGDRGYELGTLVSHSGKPYRETLIKYIERHVSLEGGDLISLCKRKGMNQDIAEDVLNRLVHNRKLVIYDDMWLMN